MRVVLDAMWLRLSSFSIFSISTPFARLVRKDDMAIPFLSVGKARVGGHAELTNEFYMYYCMLFQPSHALQASI